MVRRGVKLRLPRLTTWALYMPQDEEQPTRIDPRVTRKGGELEEDECCEDCKHGHTFLFCVCDCRRAVLFCNTLFFFYTGIVVALIAADAIDPYASINKEDNDYISTEIRDFTEEYDIPVKYVAMAFGIATMLSACMGLFGAMTFRSSAVMFTVLWLSVKTVINGVLLNLVDLAIGVFMLYPNVLLCLELSFEIMTPENYDAREKRCFCNMHFSEEWFYSDYRRKRLPNHHLNVNHTTGRSEK